MLIRILPEDVKPLDECMSSSDDFVEAKNVCICHETHAPPRLEPDIDIPTPRGWKSCEDHVAIDGYEWSMYTTLRSWLLHDTINARENEFKIESWLPFVRGYRYASPDQIFALFWDTIQWRRTCGCNDMLDDLDTFAPRMRELDDVFPSSVIGHDKVGHPIILERVATVSSGALLERFSDDEFLSHMVARKEIQCFYLRDLSHKLGKRIYKSVSVIDVGGMDRGHMGRAFIHRFKLFTLCFATRYPESVHRLVVINTPFLFQMFWSIAKVFLHPVTASKVSIVGSNVQSALHDATFLPGTSCLGKLTCKTSWGDMLQELKISGTNKAWVSNREETILSSYAPKCVS